MKNTITLVSGANSMTADMYRGSAEAGRAPGPNSTSIPGAGHGFIAADQANKTARDLSKAQTLSLFQTHSRRLLQQYDGGLNGARTCRVQTVPGCPAGGLMHGIHLICIRGLHASIAFVVMMLSSALLSPASADTWRGTAPFCAGECLPGETQISTSSHGDGGQCWTGNKVLCRNAQPTCQALQTNTSCKGVVMICDNGFYTQTTNTPEWHSCSKYACGGCIGWTSQGLSAQSNGIIYSVSPTDDLLWLRHDGRNDGTFKWAHNEGKKVGVGWKVKQIFTGGSGIIYAINDADDLLWYHHDGLNDGSFRWTNTDGKKVGNQWKVKHVFSGGDGIIYVINEKNELLWYRHEGYTDGTFRWESNEGKKVGVGWDVQHVFYGGDGIIYAIDQNNDLLWYRHDGHDDGSFRWASNQGRKVGNGWNVKHIFYGGDGLIYVINQTNDLLWFHHDGRDDGSFRWSSNEGKKVGNGWDVRHVFADFNR
jgi:Tachylectin